MNKAADVSNYTGELTESGIRELKGMGVDKLIVQIVDPPASYPPSVWKQQITASFLPRFKLDCYVYLWNGQSFTEQVKAAEDKIRGLFAGAPTGSLRLWYDTEDVTEGPGATDKAALAAALLEAIGKATMPCGVYTGKWYADAYYPVDFILPAGVPLWIAEYDNIPDTAVWTPFWGVNRPMVKQYEGMRALGNGKIDLNVYEDKVPLVHESASLPVASGVDPRLVQARQLLDDVIAGR